jgi:hypothetical protein
VRFYELAEPLHLFQKPRNVLAGMRYEVIVGLGCSGECNLFPSRSSLTRQNKTCATHMVSAFDVWLPWAGGGRCAPRLYCSQLFVRPWPCMCHESVPGAPAGMAWPSPDTLISMEHLRRVAAHNLLLIGARQGAKERMHVQTPPRHPLHQWELKPTGFFRVKSPLGRSHVPPYNMPMYYIM